jgi:hypothetical protein
VAGCGFIKAWLRYLEPRILLFGKLMFEELGKAQSMVVLIYW